jgi:DNA-binding GntR family transcriptional regulator
MAGQLKPGTHLKGPDLAAEFGVSRVTIHDALRILERHGLAEIHPRRGAFVSDPTHSELTEILDIRSVLFGLAARTACEEGNDAFINEFALGVRRQRELAADPATVPQDYGAASVELQRMVAEAAKNARLRAMLDDLTNRSIWRLVFRDGPLDHTTVQRRNESAAIWTELAEALQQRSPEAAENAARKLIRASRAFIVAVMSGSTHG